MNNQVEWETTIWQKNVNNQVDWETTIWQKNVIHNIIQSNAGDNRGYNWQIECEQSSHNAGDNRGYIGK